MSYSEVTPQYYQMHMPDSPWHAGSPGWKSQPWPTFGANPNLVGPPRLAVNGLGAYYKPMYEKPIAGLGVLGDDAAAIPASTTPAPSTPAADPNSSCVMMGAGGFPWFTALICGTVLGVTYLRRKKY